MLDPTKFFVDESWSPKHLCPIDIEKYVVKFKP
jgi:hypothetical protein